MILSLKYHDNILAVLMANGPRVKIVDALEDFRAGLEKLLQEGISYPSHSPLHQFNCNPAEGDRFLEKLGQLYATKFGLKTELMEYVRPVERGNDLVIRFPHANFGDLSASEVSDVAKALQHAVVLCSMEAAPKDSHGGLSSQKRKEQFRLRTAYAPAASLQLAFLVGPSHNETVTKTIELMLGHIERPEIDARNLQLYREFTALEEIGFDFEIYSERISISKTKALNPGTNRFGHIVAQLENRPTITIKGRIHKLTDSSSMIGIRDSRSGKTYNCYFPEEMNADYNKIRSSRSEIEIRGRVEERSRVDRIDVEYADLLDNNSS